MHNHKSLSEKSKIIFDEKEFSPFSLISSYRNISRVELLRQDALRARQKRTQMRLRFNKSISNYFFTAAILDLTENLTSSWQIRHPLSEAVLLLASPAPASVAVSPPVPLKI